MEHLNDHVADGTSLPSHLPKPARILFRAEPSSDSLVDTFAQDIGVSRVTAQILLGRGIDSEDAARAFLFPSLREHLPDPRRIMHMPEAAQEIIDAVVQQRQITVFTDFDVDGLSAGAQLFLYLKGLGAKVNHYTPNRFTEGYGLSIEAVDKLIKAKTELLITVDCGVTNAREIAHAARAGIETIVIDHHQVSDIPPAKFVVDPAQDGCPFQEYELCAAGLIWMLLIVLRGAAKHRAQELPEGAIVPDPKDFLDLACLGTICDMVPLRAVNRLIALRGIEALRKTKRPGLIALKESAGVEKKKRFGSSHVSFGLGPRINAAGRLDDPTQVFDLLITGSKSKAKTISSRLNRLNQERKGIEEFVRLACIKRIEDEGLKDEAAFAIYGDDFHSGVIGIAAQRLVEQYHKPAAVMAPSDDDVTHERVIKGSVRSIRGFHVSEALAELGDLLLKHGGHAQAGGFSVLPENLEAFQKGFNEVARARLDDEDYVRSRTADAIVRLQDIDFDVVSELNQLQPFGIGNPAPLLVAHRIRVDTVQSLGNGHLRLRLRDNDCFIGAVAWRFRGHPLLAKGKQVSIAFQPEINSYKGMSSVQLNIREVWAESGQGASEQ